MGSAFYFWKRIIYLTFLAFMRVCLSRAGLCGCITSKKFCLNENAADRVMPVPACLVTTLTEFSTFLVTHLWSDLRLPPQVDSRTLKLVATDLSDASHPTSLMAIVPFAV